MRTYRRKSTPRVRDGKVRRKNRIDRTARARPAADVRVERRRPGTGASHILRVDDVRRFLGLLPDWDELAVGLERVLLATVEDDCMGFAYPGTVAVCAWETWDLWEAGFVEDHRPILDRLMIDTERTKSGDYRVHWTENGIRGFQLMHILLHELGHHHDRMSTANDWHAPRGETYAERYALEYAERLWDAYFREFEV